MVVFTRENIGPYAEAIAHLKVTSIAMPVTRYEPGDREALRRALGDRYDAIVVASARGAEAVVEALPEDVRPREIWAVGAATARVLLSAGLAVRTPEDGADAEALSRAVMERRPARVLVPRAEEGREEGIALMRAGGAVVDELVAYRTLARAADDPLVVEGRDAIVEGRASIVAVFAPSQVTALVSICGELSKLSTRFVAIGNTTATALVHAGVYSVAAATPTPAGMADAIASVFP